MNPVFPRHSQIFDQISMPLALGMLRLSVEGRPADVEAEAVIHLALNRGVRVFDTADVYSLNDSDVHYGEHMIRRATKSWRGPIDEVRVLTKAGLQQEGRILHLGLCNTSAAELRQAQRHFSVAVVQNELSVLNRRIAQDGLLKLTTELGIPFLAYRPLGGTANKDKLNQDPILVPLAQRHQATAQEIALAAVLDSTENVIPIVGATRPASVLSSVRSTELVLDGSDRMALSLRYSFAPASGVIGFSPNIATIDPSRESSTSSGPCQTPDVVLLMGIQGAGKSEMVLEYVEAG